MYKQKLTLILTGSIILVFCLAGCINEGEIIPYTNDEKEIENIIQSYASALNNENWSDAKSYCVLNSYAYQMIELYEFAVDFQNIESFTFRIDNIKDINIDGNYAQADVHIISSLGSWHENIYLQKIGDIWKIYNNEYLYY